MNQSPNFSTDITNQKPNSFLQRGFSLVYNIMHLVLVVFGVLLVLVVIFISVFSVNLAVRAKGALEPATYSEVRTEIPSTIKQVHCNSGDIVAKDQLIVELTEDQYHNDLFQAEESLKAARAELLKTIRKYEMSYAVYKDVIPTLSEKKVSEIPDIAILQSIVNKEEKQVEMRRKKVKKTRLFSPIAGVVVTPDLQKRVGTSIKEGETVAIVADLSKWVVKAYVPERDIPKVRIGDTTKIKISAFPFMEFKVFTGTVTAISSIPMLKLNTEIMNQSADEKDEKQQRYFEVTIDLADSYAKKKWSNI